jgi:hypothetical protein
MFSRRCLIFAKEQVYWECESASRCEDAQLEMDSPFRFKWVWSHAVDFMPKSIEFSTEAYFRLVNRYNKRDLTYDVDAMNAFSGICDTLSTQTGTTFFWGLPTRDFVRNLLCSRGGKLRLIKVFPIWSWLAWNSNMDWIPLPEGTFDSRIEVCKWSNRSPNIIELHCMG